MRVFSIKVIAITFLASCIIAVGSFRDSLCFPVNALEQSNVKSTFSATYEIDESNKSEVQLSIKFKNIGENPTILTSYDLNVGNIHPGEIGVSHGDDGLEYELLESSGFVVRILIGDVLLRPDEEYEVVVSYVLEDFFILEGGSYESILPVFRLGSDSSADFIEVVFPGSFGPVNFSNLHFDVDDDGDFTSVEFTEIEDADHVILSVGSSKYFSVNIERKLENDSDTYIQREIEILPDLEFQTIIFSSISPYPKASYRTDEGNYVLNYDIPPGNVVWVRMRAIVVVDQIVDSEVFLDSQERVLMLGMDDEWTNITDEKVLNDIESADSSQSLRDQIAWIYKYVLENLNLSENFRQLHGSEYRKGANVALKTYKNASAEDFADSFVGLARIAGIPARSVGGYVFPYSSPGESIGMYHVWPQYWSDQCGWVSVDPSYEKYSGYPQLESVGLRRVITSVISGSAGDGFSGDSTDEIFLTNETKDIQSEMTVQLNVDKSVYSGVSNSGSILVENTGNSVILWQGGSISGQDFEAVFEESFGSRLILPGNTVELEFSIRIEKWHTSGTRELELVAVAESPGGTLRETVSSKVNVEPLWWVEPVSWGLTILLFVLVTIICYGLIKVFIWLYVSIRRLGSKVLDSRK